MSVITSYTLTCSGIDGKSLAQALRDEGIVKNGEVYSVPKSEFIPYDNVFFYEAIDAKYANEKEQLLRQSILPIIPKEAVSNASRMIVYLPEDNNTMQWFMNYGADDGPAYLISKKYSNIQFEYKVMCELDLVAHCYIQNGKEIDIPIINEADISAYLLDNGYERQAHDKKLCNKIADTCKADMMSASPYKNKLDIPLKEELIEEAVAAYLHGKQDKKKSVVDPEI